MALLALDTSTSHLSIALDPGEGRPAIESHAEVGQRHAALALPAIRAMLDQAGRTMRDLDAIAFGAGPGSFTGVRIACGIAQGLALALGRPLVAIGAFEAIAETARRAHAPAARFAAVAIDARMHEVYWCAMRLVEDEWRPIAPAVVAPADRVPSVAPAAGEAWIACGSGFASDGATLAARLGLDGRSAATFAGPYPLVRPHAATMLAIARCRLARGEVVDPALAAPVYVRDRVALTRAERAAGATLGAPGA